MVFYLLFALIAVGFFPLIAYLVQSVHKKDNKNVLDILDAEFLQEEIEKEPSNWWTQKRSHFNQSLTLSGLTSGIAVLLFARFLNAFYISAWQLFLSLTVFMIYMGAANLVFGIGLTIEKTQSPQPLEPFRKRTYSILFWIANAIPIIFALSLIIRWSIQT